MIQHDALSILKVFYFFIFLSVTEKYFKEKNITTSKKQTTRPGSKVLILKYLCIIDSYLLPR